jgi:hypothetical protein
LKHFFYLFRFTLLHPNVKHFFLFLLSRDLRLLFHVWFCGSRVVQPSFGYRLLYPPLVSTQCDSRDYRHNNVVTAGGNNPKQEPKTETRTKDKGTVKSNTWQQRMQTILAHRPTGIDQPA